jgi:SNF2 family DNA or RNA helicase
LGSARLTLDEQRLTLFVVDETALLDPVHAVFFTNILGMDFNGDPPSYSMPNGETTASALRDIRSYAADIDVSLTFDSRIAAFLNSLDAEETSFVRAITSGEAQKNAPATAVAVPGLVRPLKAYQIPAVAHLVSVKNGANFSVPGSGKTTVVLSAFAIMKAAGDVEVLMAVGPRSSFMAWEEEFEVCFGRAPVVARLVGSRDHRRRQYRQIDGADLILCTYQLVANDESDLVQLLSSRKVLLVIDESHNIKRLAGGTWADSLIGLAPYAARRVVLSGTPAPNSMADLWSQLTFLWPTHPPLGSREELRRLLDDDPEHSVESVRDRIAPLYWRTKKTELGLPVPTFHRVQVKMGQYQQAIYDVLAAKVLADVVKAPKDRGRLRPWRRARMVRLLQAASNPALLARNSDEFHVPPLDASGLPVDRIIEEYAKFETPPKMQRVAELARTLVANGNKVLVWSTFVQNVLTLEAMLPDLRPACIYGAVPKDPSENEEFNREHILKDFKTGSHYSILIANPSACAESVSLHKVCYHAIYLDRSFNAAHYLQSLDRIHRTGLGAGDAVHYYLFESTISIDGVIRQRLAQKIDRMMKVLDDELGVLNLDSPEEDFSEEGEEEADFQALLSSLRNPAQGEAGHA